MLLTKNDVVLAATGEKLSIPTTNTRWTDKYKPGLDAFAQYSTNNTEMQNQVAKYISPFIEFAKDVLSDKKHLWYKYPIYLKATGGLRTLQRPQRIQLMNCVRKLFHNTTFNPFSFEDERARVISGEEEGAYGWVAVNFIYGTLIGDAKGYGTVSNPSKYILIGTISLFEFAASELYPLLTCSRKLFD